jgi:hypothetical protein
MDRRRRDPDTDPRAHPWWVHVPRSERAGRLQRLRWLRLREWLKRRGTRIRLAVLVYVLLCVLPLLIGQPHLTMFALLPVLLVPPVGYMAYLLAWHDYHR